MKAINRAADRKFGRRELPLMRIVVILAALVIAAAAIAQTSTQQAGTHPARKPAPPADVIAPQPPSPSAAEAGSLPQSVPGRGQDQPGGDQRGTEQSPLIVKIQPSPEAAGSAGKGADKGSPEWWMFGNWSTDTWLAIFTGGLVVVGSFQLWVFGFQGKQLKRSVDAAEKSDETLERAYLWPGLGMWETGPTSTRFHITIHNTGRTAATLKSVHLDLCQEGQYPPKSVKYMCFHREDVIPPETGGKLMDTGAYCDLTGDEPKILHGYVCYMDVFKKERRCPWKHRVYRNGVSEPLEGCYSEWT
jgi:hypothetical protein